MQSIKIEWLSSVWKRVAARAAASVACGAEQRGQRIYVWPDSFRFELEAGEWLPAAAARDWLLAAGGRNRRTRAASCASAAKVGRGVGARSSPSSSAGERATDWRQRQRRRLRRAASADGAPGSEALAAWRVVGAAAQVSRGSSSSSKLHRATASASATATSAAAAASAFATAPRTANASATATTSLLLLLLLPRRVVVGGGAAPMTTYSSSSSPASSLAARGSLLARRADKASAFVSVSFSQSQRDSNAASRRTSKPPAQPATAAAAHVKLSAACVSDRFELRAGQRERPARARRARNMISCFSTVERSRHTNGHLRELYYQDNYITHKRITGNHHRTCTRQVTQAGARRVAAAEAAAAVAAEEGAVTIVATRDTCPASVRHPGSRAAAAAEAARATTAAT